MEDVAPTRDLNEMEELWCTSPETAQPAASAASAAPPCSTPESGGGSRRHVKALACVEPSKKGRRNRSPYWAYFDKFVVNGLQKAVCKYCSRQVGCDPRSGTSVLKNHVERCKAYPPKLISNEQCSPLPVPVPALAKTSAKPSEKLPAAITLYQMMEAMGGFKQEPLSGSSMECNGGYKTGRTPWAIRETDFSYKIRFDMPSMTRNDVKVWVEDNILAVEAEKVSKRCQVDIDALSDVDEGSEDKYKSRISLPYTVNVDKVTAEVKDGVLYITIPKARVIQRRINVNVQ